MREVKHDKTSSLDAEEILLDWAISRNPHRHVRRRFDLPALPADESELLEYFNLLFPDLELQLWDDVSEAQQLLQLAMASGDRDKDGLLSVQELHYGLLCVYGYQVLTEDAARLLAFAPSTPEQLQEQLQELMEALNEGVVSVKEVKAVLREAALLERGQRRDLLWALGAWYVNVQREDSGWRMILSAALRRWLPSEEEHHGRVLRDLGRMTRDLPKTLPMPKRLGGNEAKSRAGQACVLTLAVLIHVFYFGALINSFKISSRMFKMECT